MDKKIGLGAGIIASVLFGGTAVMSAAVMSMGVDSMLLVVLRNSLALPFLLFMMLRGKESFKLSAKEFKAMLFLNFIGMGPTNMLCFFAYDYIPVGHTTVIHFMYPAVVMALGVLLFRQRVTKWKGVALALCTGGVLCFLAISSGGEITNPVLGYSLAFASAVTYGSYILGTERTCASQMSPTKLSFYVNIFSAIQPLMYCVAMGNVSFDFPAIAWGYMLFIAVCVSVIGFVFTKISIERCGAVVASIIFTLEPITATVAGIIWLAEPYNIFTIIGAGMIVSSVIVIALDPSADDGAASDSTATTAAA